MGKFIDLTGLKFNRLLVLERTEVRNRQTMWRCKCECGNITVVSGGALKSGNTKSCGCLSAEIRQKYNDSKVIDLTNKKFGRLTVLKRMQGNKNGNSLWECICDCQNKTKCIVTGVSLRSGKTKSCGCLARENISKINKKHGKTHTRLYNIWQAMKRRCDDKNNIAYKYYGGKGIYVCDEWLHDFQCFYDWSMQHEYKDTYSIDRIDNEQPYCPENCRWTDHEHQMNNFGRNKILEYKGQKLTIPEWCKKLGLNYNTVRSRLRYGWSIQKTLETPTK